MENENEWIDHPGGFTPPGLTGETWVEVELASGETVVDIAQSFKWSRMAPDAEAIVRYRVTQAPAEPEPDLGWVDWHMSGPGPSNDLDKIYIAEYRNGDVTPPMRMYMLKWGPQADPAQEIVRYREPNGPVGSPDWGAPSRELHRVYPHLYKDVSGVQYVDVYAVHRMWGVNDPLLHEASKLLLLHGGGAVQEVIDTLARYKELEQ